MDGRVLDELCARRCEECARECELALGLDPDYTQPGTAPYSEYHLALLACVSTCSITARALRERNADRDLLLWCAETCRSSASTVEVGSLGWIEVLAAQDACAAACEECAEALHEPAESAR